ncbi:MAG TPA: hypothetical protein ENK57_22510 [Polyangiaceae bacterium]|nr:hypothetical protein [Polyangiaceae bacterium]
MPCICDRIPGECEVLLSCISNSCTYDPAPDGTPCSVGTCHSGACVSAPASCGDGLREPGPTPAREGCDDGNTLSGDACAPDCTPTVLVVSSTTGEEGIPAFVSVAEDDSGELLFVWTATSGESAELRGRRHSSSGVPMGPELTLSADLGRGWDPRASVVGLPSGWAVVWAERAGAALESDIRLRTVSADGALSAIRRANSYAVGRQADPAAARTATGLLVAWADESGTATLPGDSRLRYRTFDVLGRPTSDELPLSPEGTSAREVFLSSDSAVTLAVWTQDTVVPFDRPSIVARRFGAATDAAPFTISDDGSEASAAFLTTGDIAVVWVARRLDARGDIHARLVHAAGDPLSATAITPLTVTPMDAPHVAEVAPRILPLTGADYLVTYEDGGVRRGVTRLEVGSSPLAPESAALFPLLADGLQGDVTLLSTSLGYWFAWSDAGGLGAPGAHRSFLAYLLPPS